MEVPLRGWCRGLRVEPPSVGAEGGGHQGRLPDRATTPLYELRPDAPRVP